MGRPRAWQEPQSSHTGSEGFPLSSLGRPLPANLGAPLSQGKPFQRRVLKEQRGKLDLGQSQYMGKWGHRRPGALGVERVEAGGAAGMVS